MNATSPFDAAVIVVNYNGGAHLRRCLAALAAQTRMPRQIVVLDNASTDGSADAIQSLLPAARVVRAERNHGYARGNNLAVAQAGEVRWIVTLNPDAFPEPDWLASLEAAAAAFPDYRMFASCLLLAEDPSRLDGAGDSYHISGLAWRRYHGKPLAYALETVEVFSPCGAAAMFRRDLFLASGGFDEDFFCYMEDVDLAFRLRLLGERCLYVPQARVLHVGSAIAGLRSRFATYHGHRNMIWVFLKNMPVPLLWWYMPVFLLGILLSLGVGLGRGQLLTVWRAKRDALRDLRQLARKRRAIQESRRVAPAALSGVMSRGWTRAAGRG